MKITSFVLVVAFCAYAKAGDAPAATAPAAAATAAAGDAAKAATNTVANPPAPAASNAAPPAPPAAANPPAPQATKGGIFGMAGAAMKFGDEVMETGKKMFGSMIGKTPSLFDFGK